MCGETISEATDVCGTGGQNSPSSVPTSYCNLARDHGLLKYLVVHLETNGMVSHSLLTVAVSNTFKPHFTRTDIR